MKREHTLLVGITFLFTMAFAVAPPVWAAEPSVQAGEPKAGGQGGVAAASQPAAEGRADGEPGAAANNAKAEDDSWGQAGAGGDGDALEVPSFSIRGEVTAGARSLSGSPRSSQFIKYRDVPAGGYISNLFLAGESTSSSRYIELRAANLKQSNDRVELSLGSHGGHQLHLFYDQSPQAFSNTGRLFLRQAAPGDYTLSNDIRGQLKAISQKDIDPNTTGTQIDTAAFGNLVAAGSSPVDLTQRRRTTALTYLGDLSPDVKLSVSYSDQDRRGVRPMAAAFSFTNQVELPEPLRYRDREWTADVEFSGERGAASLEMRTSGFTNRVSALTFDNPLVLTDAVRSPARGQLSLPPSNEAQDLSFSGVLRLWGGASLSGMLSAGRWKQNQPFLPATVNTALAVAALPASSLGGRIDTSLVDVGLNVPLGSALSAGAYYRRYGNRNRTPLLLFAETVTADASVTQGDVETRPVGYAQGNTGLEFTYRALPSLSLHLSGDQETWSRTHRDVSKTREGRYGLSADYRATSWLTARGAILSSSRRIRGEYNPGEDLPELRRYDEADRDRGESSLILLVSPPDARWDATLTYTRARDNYLRSSYGLRDDRNSSISLDGSYALSDSTSLFAGWTGELYRSALDSRFRTTAGTPPVLVDDPANDWNSRTRDDVQTYWLGLNSTLVPDKWDIELAASLSSGRSKTLAQGAAGGDPRGDANSFPDVTYTWFEPRATARYTIRQGLSMALGYRVESYHVTDFAQDTMNAYMPDSGAATSIWLGARQPSYVAHIATLELTTGF